MSCESRECAIEQQVCRRYGELQQFCGELVTGTVTIQADVVGVHPLSGGNVAGRGPDGLSELADGAALRNGLSSDFMKQGYGFCDGDCAGAECEVFA